MDCQLRYGCCRREEVCKKATGRAREGKGGEQFGRGRGQAAGQAETWVLVGLMEDGGGKVGVVGGARPQGRW